MRRRLAVESPGRIVERSLSATIGPTFGSSGSTLPRRDDDVKRILPAFRHLAVADRRVHSEGGGSRPSVRDGSLFAATNGGVFEEYRLGWWPYVRFVNETEWRASA